MEREQGRSTDYQTRLKEVKAAIAGHLKTSPADPGSNISVKRFCQRGMNLYTDALSLTWAIYNHSAPENVSSLITLDSVEQDAFKTGRDTNEQFQLKENTMVMTPPADLAQRYRPMRVQSGIITRAAYIDYALPRFEYAWVLADPPKELSRPRTFGNERGRFHDNFQRRYWDFLKSSALPPSAPEPAFLSLIFLEEIAKVNAVESIKGELSRLKPYDESFSLVPPSEVDGVRRYILRNLAKTMHHLGYLEKVQVNLAILQRRYSFDEHQIRLLYDIAFLRKGELESGAFTNFLNPIMQLVGEGSYTDAFSCRDFLLQNFPHCFPEWRREGHEGLSHPNIRQFVDERLAADIPILEGVPQAYQELILGHFEQIRSKQEAARLGEEAKTERKRLNLTASKLTLYSIGLVSRYQGIRGEVSTTHDPDIKISARNPMALRCRMSIKDLDRIEPKGIFIIKDYSVDDEGSARLKIHDSRHIYSVATVITATQIFLNLIYDGLLQRETIVEAFNSLQEKGEIGHSDTIYNLLSNPLQRRISDLQKQLDDLSDYPPDHKRVVTHIGKISMVQDLLASFKK